MNLSELLKETIRDVPDFPKPGILFKDITPLLQQHSVFSKIIDAFAERYRSRKIDAVVGIESRGFIFGAPIAYRLGASFVPVRKAGKLPFKTIQNSYALEYGEAVIEMHVDALRQKSSVLVMDDLLATGGTAEATCQLVERQKGNVVACAFVVELSFLQGRQKLNGREVFSLVEY